MARILVGILTTKPLIFYLIHKCEVAKLGSTAGNFFSGNRGEGGERDREKESEKETEKERVRHKEKEGDRADNRITGNAVLPN
jgi:hypothetical protein